MDGKSDVIFSGNEVMLVPLMYNAVRFDGAEVWKPVMLTQLVSTRVEGCVAIGTNPDTGVEINTRVILLRMMGDSD